MINKIVRYISLAGVLAMAACSSDGKVNRVAADYGRADAQTLIDSAPTMTQLEIEGYILGVRANEHEYRSAGHEKAAKLYIENFETHIRQNSDSLSKILF